MDVTDFEEHSCRDPRHEDVRASDVMHYVMASATACEMTLTAPSAVAIESAASAKQAATVELDTATATVAKSAVTELAMVTKPAVMLESDGSQRYEVIETSVGESSASAGSTGPLKLSRSTESARLLPLHNSAG